MKLVFKTPLLLGPDTENVVAEKPIKFCTVQAQVVEKLQGYMKCYLIVPTRVIWLNRIARKRLYMEGQKVKSTDMDWTTSDRSGKF